MGPSYVLKALTKWTLRVKVGEEYLKCIDVASGVQQGSVLGPVLFLLNINGCLNGLSCDAVMFADDVNIWRTIERPSDVQSLQNDVDYLPNWSQRFPMDETLKSHCQCAKATKSENSIMRAIKASPMNITPALFDK